MALFYRKTKKLGRGGYLNLSKKGASVSFGPKGLKLSTRGRLSASKGGFRFIKKIF